MRYEIDFHKAFRNRSVNPEWKQHVTTADGEELTEEDVNEEIWERDNDNDNDNDNE